MKKLLEYQNYKLHLIICGKKYPTLHSTIVLICIGEKKILVDTGYISDRYLLIDNLKSIDLEPESITDVILTHFHMDHIGNIEYFKNSNLYIGKEDFDLLKSVLKNLSNDSILDKIIKEVSNLKEPRKIRALKNMYINNHSIIEDIIGNRKRIKCIGDSYSGLDKKIIIKKTPGHTNGHISIFCEFDKNICIAGDSVPLDSIVYGKNLTDEGFINQDIDKFIETKKMILSWSDIIYPGHGRPTILKKK